MNARTLLPLALVLAGCGAGETTGEPPLAGARIGGPFVLTDGTGTVRRDADFRGRWRIVYFGYTFCPDVCPTDMQNIAAGLRAFEASDPERGARIVPLFVTIDPERDTVPVVGRYAAAFHPRMIGLTGSAQAIADAARAYGVPYAKVQSPGSTEYLMDHGRSAYLMDPEGQPVALLPADESGEAVAAELARWVR